MGIGRKEQVTATFADVVARCADVDEWHLPRVDRAPEQTAVGDAAGTSSTIGPEPRSKQITTYGV